MAAKHTPGPWELNGPGNYEICEIDLITVTACQPLDEDTPDRVLADARLIAAAPDLLAACKAIRYGWGNNLTEPMALVNAAIDKAEGR